MSQLEAEAREWEPVEIEEGRDAFVRWITSIGCNDEPPEWDEAEEEFKEQEVQWAFRAYMAGCEYANPEPATSHTAQESRGEVVWSGEVEVIPGCAYSRHKLFFSMEEAPDVSLDKLRDFEHHVTITRITLPSTEPPVPQTVNVEEEKHED